MIVFNFTGLRRTYWIPEIRRKSSGDGLWFTSFRWLGGEVVFYSREMGSAFIKRLNAGLVDKPEAS